MPPASPAAAGSAPAARDCPVPGGQRVAAGVATASRSAQPSSGGGQGKVEVMVTPVNVGTCRVVEADAASGEVAQADRRGVGRGARCWSRRGLPRAQLTRRRAPSCNPRERRGRRPGAQVDASTPARGRSRYAGASLLVNSRQPAGIHRRWRREAPSRPRSCTSAGCRGTLVGCPARRSGRPEGKSAEGAIPGRPGARAARLAPPARRPRPRFRIGNGGPGRAPAASSPPRSCFSAMGSLVSGGLRPGSDVAAEKRAN